jgi:hypothetical protein
MHRIDTADAVNGQFNDGNPQTGQLATQVPADWLNDMQENIVQAVEHASIPLAKGDGTQLWKAILAIAQGVVGSGGGGEGGGAGSVPTSRAVNTTGLLSGGHALDTDLDLAVPKASTAEVLAGVNAAKAITPDVLGTLFGVANPTSLPSEMAITFPGGFQLRVGVHLGNMTEGQNQVTFVTVSLCDADQCQCRGWP